jgi:CRP/FNR family transcriptional regulator, nitrogen fixation regulation protein
MEINMLNMRGHTHHAQASVPDIILKFRKGEIVYSQGDPATDWFEVIAGTVRTCYLYSDGHRQLTGFFYPGDVFGIEVGMHQASAEAVTDCRLRRVCRGNRDDSAVSEDIPSPKSNDVLETALRNAHACIFLLGHRTAAERMAAFLLATSQRIGAERRFQLPMSRADIADHLGLTIHTVSRTLSEFVRRGMIALNGPQTILIEDRDSLYGLAGRDENTQPPNYPSDFILPANNNAELACVAGR